MFSQPGVFGTSDTSSVINKTNPMAGLVGTAPVAATQAMPVQAQNPAPAAAIPPPTPVTTLESAVRTGRPIGFTRSRMMGPAFYGE
jgi:hypothetical protein